MSTHRVSGRAAALDGRLWVVGGITDATFDLTCSMEVYDPATNAWTNSTPYPGCTHRTKLTLARAQTKPSLAGTHPLRLTAGGGLGNTPGLIFHSMVAANGLLVVVGATKDSHQPTVATFDPATRAWTAWPPANETTATMRIGTAAASLGDGAKGLVVSLGGAAEMAGPALHPYASAQQLSVSSGPGTRWTPSLP